MALMNPAADLDKLNGGAQAPAMQNAPPPVEDGSVSFDESGDFKVETSETPEPVAPEPATTPAKKKLDAIPVLDVGKEFGKPEAEKPPVEKPAVEEKPSESVAPDTTGRDYSKFDPEVAAIAKHLRNKQFAEFAPKIQEWKQAAAKLADTEKKLAEVNQGPQFSYESADAYVMDPQYQQYAELGNKAQLERDFLVRQLELVNSGEEWFELTGYDEKGQPKLIKHDAPSNGKVDAAAQAKLMREIAQGDQCVNIAIQRVNGIKQQYATNAKAAATELDAVHTTLMPNVKPEAFTPEEKEWYQFALDKAPKRFAGHPLSKTPALMFVAYMRLFKVASEALEKVQKYEKVGDLKQAAGPKIVHKIRNPRAEDADEISLDEDEMFAKR